MIYVVIGMVYDGEASCQHNIFASISKEVAQVKLDELLEKQNTINKANEELKLWIKEDKQGLFRDISYFKNGKVVDHLLEKAFQQIQKRSAALEQKKSELISKYNIEDIDNFLTTDDIDYLIEEVESD